MLKEQRPRTFIIEANAFSVNAVMDELFKHDGVVVGLASFRDTAMLCLNTIQRERESLDVVIIASTIGQVLSSHQVKYLECTLTLVEQLRQRFNEIIVGGARDARHLELMKKAGCDDAILHQGCGGFTGAETIQRALELWQTAKVCC